MPSFKATIQEVLHDPSGIVDLFLQPPLTCSPASLGVTSATILGDPTVPAPEGACEVPQVVAIFPVSQIEDFSAGDEVRVSWRSRSDGTLGTLRIAYA